MKNFSKYIDKALIGKIINAHDLGVMGNAIDSNLIAELKAIEPEYLPNLKCSDEAKEFIDNFLTDVETFRSTREGSTYAEVFVDMN